MKLLPIENAEIDFGIEGIVRRKNIIESVNFTK